MPRPGSNVVLLDTPTPVSVPSDTGTWFVVGTSDRGPANAATLILSLDQFTTVFGARQAYSVLYDAVETFFREGGNRCYVGRVVGPTPTTGTRNLLDGSAGVSLTVNAIGPGAWSSSYKVGVVAGNAAGTFQIQVSDASNVVLEQSGDLSNQSAAIAWSAYSSYVRIVLGATALNPAVVALTALSAGADDRTNITDTQWANALASFGPALGPGQVSAPGRTSSTAYGQIKTHAEANNRVGLLDAPDSATAATLKAAAALATSRFMAQPFAPWVIIPGVTVGTVRAVPPSAFIAGLIARNDASYGTNQASAGTAGIARYVTDLSQPDWDDATRTDLNINGINVIRRMLGGVRNYGWRALVNAVSDANWVGFNNARFYMDLYNTLNAIGEGYVFSQIDGQNGTTINKFHGSLGGEMLRRYQQGALFGDTADVAFQVDTGPTVNTLASITAQELHAAVAYKNAPMAEYVLIQISKRLVTQTF